MGHWDLWAFTLAFAYHKLVPVCSKADPFNPMTRDFKSKPNFTCTSDESTHTERHKPRTSRALL